MVARCVELYYSYKRPTDCRLFSYDEPMLFSEFDDVYKTLINVAEVYFLSLYRASNTKTLKVKVLFPSLCSLKLFTNQKQVICVVMRKEVILNRLEELLALNICTKNFLASEILMEGFKNKQSRTKG